MKINKENLSYLSVGTIGIILLVYLSFFTKVYVEFNILYFALLAITGLILQKISLNVGEFKITLDTIVMIGAYSILGLVPTLWLILLLVFGYGIISDPRPKRRIYSNTGMFILIFVSIHFLFKLLGIELIHIMGFANKMKVVFFAFLVFVLNWGLLYTQFKIRREKMPINWQESIKWDFYGNFIVVPLTILFLEVSFRYEYLGIISFSIIIILINGLFKLIRNLVFMNSQLRVVHEVAASISSRLDISETTSSILEGINELVDCDFCSIIEIQEDNITLKKIASKNFNDISIDENILEACFATNMSKLGDNNKSFIIENLKRSNLIIEKDCIPKDINSIICEPLVLENKVIGYILICSKQANKFSVEQLQILDLLANQAVVAIENARLYKEAQNKAIKDELTGLYNQRYFYDTLDLLAAKCLDCNREKCIGCNRTSLIIFDIDHFKKINDTYGHQTGDKILKEVASIITDNVRIDDVVSRYGGEEFTVLLPKTSQSNAYQIADRIRKTVENTTFYGFYQEKINLTISGGVSEYPYNADSGPNLLAYADRAMYIGSKRQGRNKISTYAS